MAPAVSLAQSTAETPSISIPRVTRAPKLSDFIDGRPREAETVVTDFRQFDPGDGAPVSQPTTAYLSYDSKNIYVGFVAMDDPKLIRARVAKRKQIENDDRVTINIDTMHDHRHAYWFDVNPYAIQFDGITTDGYGDDVNWEGLWYSEAKILADRYIVLITVPFKTLRFPSGLQQRWGVVLGRFIGRNGEFSMWPFVSRRRLPQFVGQFGHMDGLEGISPGRNVQITPYAMGTGSHYLDQLPGAPPRLVTEATGRVGADAKVVIKDSLTLDMTLNPDFSQVESDEPQVTVNQRYEVFFPERRPFFLDNASYFTTPQNLFFSRRIADPEYGMRLTGKLGRWGIGVLATDDRAPGQRLAATDPLRGQRASNGVLSLQRDFFTDSHIRLFITDREFAGSYNRVGSLDLRLRLKNNFFLTSQAITSVSRDTRGNQLSGNAYFTALSRSSRNWQYSTTYTDRSPNLRADLGYIPRTDIREWKATLSRRWWVEKKTLVNFGPTLSVLRNWNRLRQVQDWSADTGWVMEFKRLTQLSATHTESFELYQNQEFRKRINTFVFNSEWFKWLALASTYSFGDAVNYYPASGYAPFLGDSRYLSAALTIRPQPRLRLDETYIFSRLQAQPGWNGSADAPVIYNDHILRSKANYQFTRALSLRAIVDYNGILPNTSLVSLDRTKRFGYDILLTYLLHPGTALYAGYTDIYQNLRLDPTRPPYLNLTGSPDLNTGRIAFVKLSYQLHF